MKRDIIICDDDEGILDVAKIVLEDKGYKVHLQPNAEKVINQIEEIQPRLLFLDLWMPTGNGEDITKKIKNHPQLKDTIVVIVSANIDTEKIAIRAGADAFLCKPFDIDRLEELAEKYMN